MSHVAPILMIAGTAYQIHSGIQAKDAQKAAAAEAERIGRENAAIIEAETREEIKRTKDSQKDER